MGFVSDFLDAIEYLIQKYQKECTTIYSGTVQSVSDKSCSMNVNGNVYNNIAYYGIAPIVGNSYRVFVPFNNMSLAFIIVPSTTTSGSSDVSSVNGKTGEVNGFNDASSFPIYPGSIMRDILTKLGVSLSGSLPPRNTAVIHFRASRPYAAIGSIFFSNRSEIGVSATRINGDDIYVYVTNMNQEGNSVALADLNTSLGIIVFWCEGGFSLEYVNG